MRNRQRIAPTANREPTGPAPSDRDEASFHQVVRKSELSPHLAEARIDAKEYAAPQTNPITLRSSRAARVRLSSSPRGSPSSGRHLRGPLESTLPTHPARRSRPAAASASLSRTRVPVDRSGTLGSPRRFRTRSAVWAYYRLDTDAEPGLPDVLPREGESSASPARSTSPKGACAVKVAAWRGGMLADHLEAATSFTIHADDFYPSGRLPDREQTVGLIRHQWSIADSDAGAE